MFAILQFTNGEDARRRDANLPLEHLLMTFGGRKVPDGETELLKKVFPRQVYLFKSNQFIFIQHFAVLFPHLSSMKSICSETLLSSFGGYLITNLRLLRSSKISQNLFCAFQTCSSDTKCPNKHFMFQKRLKAFLWGD